MRLGLLKLPSFIHRVAAPLLNEVKSRIIFYPTKEFVFFHHSFLFSIKKGGRNPVIGIRPQKGEMRMLLCSILISPLFLFIKHCSQNIFLILSS